MTKVDSLDIRLQAIDLAASDTFFLALYDFYKAYAALQLDYNAVTHYLDQAAGHHKNQGDYREIEKILLGGVVIQSMKFFVSFELQGLNAGDSGGELQNPVVAFIQGVGGIIVE